MALLNLFATAPKGIEGLLAQELRALGAENIAEKLGGVTFEATLEIAYKICLWSRFANRVLLLLTHLPASTPDELYQAVQTIVWHDHMTIQKTFAVQCVCSQSQINHSLFAAQKIKDAIVDQFRAEMGDRPTVSKKQPDVSIYVYLFRDEAMISIDLSGESLHKRGYRLAGGSAPLKENLAAAILYRANWPAIANHRGTFIDPMCGSGTLLIEAALIAADIAPGLQRDYMGFLGWKKHQPSIWEKLLQEAHERKNIGLQQLPVIVGYDADSEAISIAFENIERAGLIGHIHVERRDIEVFSPKANVPVGLVITNPPYGERLGEIDSLKPLYATLGARLKETCIDWHAAVFTGNPELGKQMGLRAHHTYAFFNGPIACKLLLFHVQKNYFVDNSVAAENERRIRSAKKMMADFAQPSALINRLKKNLKHFKRQAKRQNDAKFRLYDCDLPDYKFIIDVAEDAVYVTEYSSPKSVSEQKILRHRAELLSILPDILALSAANIFFEITSERHKLS